MEYISIIDLFSIQIDLHLFFFIVLIVSLSLNTFLSHEAFGSPDWSCHVNIPISKKRTKERRDLHLIAHWIFGLADLC